MVVYHAARHLNKEFAAPWLAAPFQFGHAGVDLFFVLSGFVILFVHHSDIGNPERVWRYWRNRAVRILPIYWVAMVATLLMLLVGKHPLPSVGRLALDGTLLPSVQRPLLEVAWTLQFEVMFYAVFSVLILNRKAGLVCLAVWLGLVGAATAAGGIVGVPSVVTSIFCVEFLAGMAAAQAALRNRVASPRLLAAAGAGLFLASGLMENIRILDGYGVLARLAYGCPAAMLICGLAISEQRVPFRVPRWLSVLGAASYSIYLFQFVFIGVLWQAMRLIGLDRHAPLGVMLVLLAAFPIAGGVAVSRLLEQPMLRMLRPHRPTLRAQDSGETELAKLQGRA